MHYLFRLYNMFPQGIRQVLKRLFMKIPAHLFYNRLLSLEQDKVPNLYAYWNIPYDEPLLKIAQELVNENITQLEQELFVCGLSHVYLQLDNGLVEVEGGKILAESGMKSNRLRAASLLGNKKSGNIPHFSDGTYATIVTVFDRNYYHWFIDTLPRLYLFSALNLDEPVTLLMRPDSKLYQTTSLRWCLPKNMTVQYVSDHKKVGVEKLLMPSYIRSNTNGYVPIEHLNYVRDAIFKNVPIQTKTDQRIYISRSRASRRRVLNEDEVIACLLKYGYKIVQTEKLTLEQQVAQFRAATHIVSPHGAGLVNMLFADNATIVEFLGDPNPGSLHFGRLAATLGHKHHYLPVKQKGKDTDMFVDISVLEKKLAELNI
jgi:glycosyl transferase family 61